MLRDTKKAQQQHQGHKKSEEEISRIYNTVESRINCKLECTKIILLPEIDSVEYFTKVLFFNGSNIFSITKCIMKSYNKKKFRDTSEFISQTVEKLMNFNPVLKLTCFKNFNSYIYPSFLPKNHEFIRLPDQGLSDTHLCYHELQSLPLEVSGKCSGIRNKNDDPNWFYQAWNVYLTLSADPEVIINLNHMGFREQQCIQSFIARGMFSNSNKGHIGESIEFNIFHYDYIIKQTMNSENGLIKKKLISSFIRHLLHSCAGNKDLRRGILQHVCTLFFGVK